MAAFRFTLDGRRIAAGPHRLRRHGGNAEARQRERRRRSQGVSLDEPASWERAIAALARGLPADLRHAGLRRLSHGRGARPAPQGADGDCRRDAGTTRVLGHMQGGGLMAVARRILETKTVGKTLAHDSAALHVQGSADLCRRHARAGGPRPCLSGLRQGWRAGRHRGARSRCRARGAGRHRGADREGYSRRE